MNNEKQNDEPWYGFLTEAFGCVQASVIRCFLAPMYMPYIPDKSGSDTQTDSLMWLTYFYKLTDRLMIVGSEYKSVKSALKGIGSFLCEAVESEKEISCFDYLGKNRNAADYPERFIESLCPNRQYSSEIFNALIEYYCILLKVIYPNDDCKKELHNLLLYLEKQNTSVAYFGLSGSLANISAIQEMQDGAARFLASFCVLSAAHAAKTEDKNGVDFDINALIPKINTFLEMNHSEEAVSSHEYLKRCGKSLCLSYEDLIALNRSVVLVRNEAFIDLIYDINMRNKEALQLQNQDESKIKELLQELTNYQMELMADMLQRQFEVDKGSPLLMKITDLKKFWDNTQA